MIKFISRTFATQILYLVMCMLSSTQINAQGYVDILPDEVKGPFRERYTQITSAIRVSHSDEWAGVYTRLSLIHI